MSEVRNADYSGRIFLEYRAERTDIEKARKAVEAFSLRPGWQRRLDVGGYTSGFPSWWVDDYSTRSTNLYRITMQRGTMPSGFSNPVQYWFVFGDGFMQVCIDRDNN